MNKTVELVNEWASFEQKYKDGTIEDFCRHYLISQREKKAIGQNFSGAVPPIAGPYLSKLMGRIIQIMMIYIERTILDITEIKRPEDFYVLGTIRNMGDSRKTDIINFNFLELSSGIDVINRLLKEKLIEERSDPTDKRAKLVKITGKGEKVLLKCYEKFTKMSDITFWGMSEDDQKLCIQLLRGVEIKHAKLVHEVKHKSLDEIHELVTGVKVKKAK
jgi:DNA-binding MarR family transcriptional regulator